MNLTPEERIRSVGRPASALALLMTRSAGCERTTNPGFGHCFAEARVLLGNHTANEVCVGCIAWAALQNMGRGA